jgi:hypothetical protein
MVDPSGDRRGLTVAAFLLVLATIASAIGVEVWITGRPAASPVLSASTAPTRPGPSPSGPARVRRGEVVGVGHTCLDVDGGVAKDGNRVQVWECNGTRAQLWTFDLDGTVRVIGYCLQAGNGSTSAGVRVEISPCRANLAQQWRIDRGGIVNSASGLCLTSPGDSVANGTQAEIDYCQSAPGQRWTIPPAVG